MWCVTVQLESCVDDIQYRAIVLQYETYKHLNMLHSDLIYKSL